MCSNYRLFSCVFPNILELRCNSHNKIKAERCDISSPMYLAFIVESLNLLSQRICSDKDLKLWILPLLMYSEDGIMA